MSLYSYKKSTYGNMTIFQGAIQSLIAEIPHKTSLLLPDTFVLEHTQELLHVLLFVI